MASFSKNQVTHLYVAETLVNSGTVDTNKEVFAAVTDNTKIGVVYDKAGNPSVLTRDALGEITRSDRMTNIEYVNAVKAVDLRKPISQVQLNGFSSAPTVAVGDTLILRLNIKKMFGMSDEDVYVKDCAITAGSTTWATEAAALVTEMQASWSREASQIFDFNSTNITEKVQSNHLPVGYKRGIKNDPQIEVSAQVIVISATDEVTYDVPVVKNTTVGYISGTAATADLEWFALGDRGDMYRGMGWPNTNETAGKIDLSKEYDLVTVHYSFVGSGVNVEKSEKTIVIAVYAGSTPSTSAVATATANLVAALKKNTVNGILADHETRIATLEA